MLALCVRVVSLEISQSSSLETGLETGLDYSPSIARNAASVLARWKSSGNSPSSQSFAISIELDQSKNMRVNRMLTMNFGIQ
jgi:hypothetical protein